MDRLFVVRHGERVNMRSAGGEKWFEDPEYQFEPLQLKNRKPLSPEDMAWNVPLSARGKEQADHAGKVLKNITGRSRSPVHVFSSPAWRCQQTADGIARRLGTKFTVLQGLYEFLQKGVLVYLFSFFFGPFASQLNNIDPSQCHLLVRESVWRLGCQTVRHIDATTVVYTGRVSAAGAGSRHR